METRRDLGLLMAAAFNAYVDALHERLRVATEELDGGPDGDFTDFRPVDGYLFRVLHHRASATVTEISELLGVTKQAASQAVQSLQRRGYVVVEADGSDGRRRIVRLSAKGEAVRGHAIGIADDIEAELVTAVGAHAVSGLRRSLDALIDSRAEGGSALVRGLAAVGVGRAGGAE